jgi:hypothetical protein
VVLVLTTTADIIGLTLVIGPRVATDVNATFETRGLSWCLVPSA